MKSFLQHINEAPMTTTGYDGPYQTRPTLDNWTFPAFEDGQPVDDNLRPIYVGPGGPNPTVGYPYVDDRFRPTDVRKPGRGKPSKPKPQDPDTIPPRRNPFPTVLPPRRKPK